MTIRTVWSGNGDIVEVMRILESGIETLDLGSKKGIHGCHSVAALELQFNCK